MGSILAKPGPIVPLTDAQVEKTKGVFALYKPAVSEAEEAGEEEEEEEAPEGSPPKPTVPEYRIPYKDLQLALYQCGVCPVDVGGTRACLACLAWPARQTVHVN